MKMKIGYIRRKRLDNGRNEFSLIEASYSRKINSRGDRIFSKILAYPEDYTDVQNATEMMSGDDGLIVVDTVFFLNDELKEKAERWISWANTVDESKYSLFYSSL